MRTKAANEKEGDRLVTTQKPLPKIKAGPFSNTQLIFPDPLNDCQLVK